MRLYSCLNRDKVNIKTLYLDIVCSRSKIDFVPICTGPLTTNIQAGSKAAPPIEAIQTLHLYTWD